MDFVKKIFELAEKEFLAVRRLATFVQINLAMSTLILSVIMGICSIGVIAEYGIPLTRIPHLIWIPLGASISIISIKIEDSKFSLRTASIVIFLVATGIVMIFDMVVFGRGVVQLIGYCAETPACAQTTWEFPALVVLLFLSILIETICGILSVMILRKGSKAKRIGIATEIASDITNKRIGSKPIGASVEKTSYKKLNKAIKDALQGDEAKKKCAMAGVDPYEFRDFIGELIEESEYYTEIDVGPFYEGNLNEPKYY